MEHLLQISGHMLRQSVMGSDMSYNDMMEDRPVQEVYKATISGSEHLGNRDYWIITMEAKAKGLPYPKRKSWIDKEYFLPVKEELYAKSGKLLKTSKLSDIKKIQGRWFPGKFEYKDELKRNSKGTEWIIDNIEFDYIEPRPGEVAVTKADISGLEKLGWKHQISIVDGIKSCFDPRRF